MGKKEKKQTDRDTEGRGSVVPELLRDRPEPFSLGAGGGGGQWDKGCDHPAHKAGQRG